MDLQKKKTTYFPQPLFLSLTALKGVRENIDTTQSIKNWSQI